MNKSWTNMSWKGTTWHGTFMNQHVHDWNEESPWYEKSWTNMSWKGTTWHEHSWTNMSWHEHSWTNMSWHENKPTWHGKSWTNMSWKNHHDMEKHEPTCHEKNMAWKIMNQHVMTWIDPPKKSKRLDSSNLIQSVMSATPLWAGAGTTKLSPPLHARDLGIRGKNF